MHGDEIDPLRTALTWAREGRAVALATVVETWGSAPRRAGSHMVIDASGRFAGSVSGGCVEVAVADEARGVLGDGRARLLEYGVADEEAWAVGLACGGRVRVLVAPVSLPAWALIERAVAAEGGGATVVIGYDLETGAALAADDDGSPLSGGPAAEARVSGRARTVEVDDRSIFLRPYTPPVRLVLVGAVHIAQPLAALAAAVGYCTVVVDPRSAFARRRSHLLRPERASSRQMKNLEC